MFSSFIKNNQEKIALIIGYFLVAALFFNLGRIFDAAVPPSVFVEEPKIDLANIQFNNIATTDNSQTPEVAGVVDESQGCLKGQIKGNISVSGKIYHLPGGAFYERTKPEMCFDNEEAASAAGFRKSSR